MAKLKSPKTVCVVEGCGILSITKGRCNKHYLAYRRKVTNNAVTHKYEKTPNGFLMRAYRNMKSRVEGVQKAKHYLYVGKELLPKEAFYAWAKNSLDFWRLFKEWTAAGYDQRLTPSVDRIDSAKGYGVDNMQWLTHSQNSAKASEERCKNVA